MVQTKLSNIASYLDVLENSFRDFLMNESISEKTRKNYLSDARHFLGWAQFKIESFQRPTTTHMEFLMALTPKVISGYKEFLIANRVPTRTANRRLSTVRSFFRFCQIQSWLTHNPAQNLTGIAFSNKTHAVEELIAAFTDDLTREGASKTTVKNYARDAQEFLDWLNETTH